MAHKVVKKRNRIVRASSGLAWVAMVSAVVLSGCNEDGPFAVVGETDETSLESAGSAMHADVFVIEGGATAGKATLVRRSTAVSLSLNTSGLVPGDAVTIWWVVFQNPENCIEGCSGDDLFSDGVNGGLFRADGKVVGGSGRAGFTSKLETGAVSMFVPNVFEDTEDSEIHIVVQTHGQAFDDLEAREEQLSAPGVGCNPDCADIQAAIFQP